jgi:energy-coupling factor transporter ATP-binding protein EcfA2
MRVSQVYCKGFRSLQQVGFSLEKYTTLIGKNDSGKSSFLKALQYLFDPHISMSPDDPCCLEDHDGGCYVEAIIDECNHEFATNGSLRIRRTHQPGPDRYEYLGKAPALPTLKDMSAGVMTRGRLGSDESLEPTIKEFAIAKLGEIAPAGHVASEKWVELYQLINQDFQLQFVEDWCSFDAGILKSLVEVVMLKADVRGEDEIHDSGKSIFTQVGGFLMREAMKSYDRIAQVNQQLAEEIDRVATKSEDGRWVIDELNQLEAAIATEVRRFDGRITAEPVLIPPRTQSIEFSVGLKISDGLVEGLDRMGHGLRRSVVFAMLRAHRTLKEQNRGRVEQEGGIQPLYLFLVEEPELYLHPQAERRRMNELKATSEDENGQVVLCTHSATFVDLSDYRGIQRFNRPDRGRTEARGWNGEDLPEDDRKTLTLFHRFDPSKSAMLFADLVILMEGQCETDAVPFIADRREIQDMNQEVEVVDCEGNENVPVYQKVLEGFGIRYVAWIDSDVKDVKSKVEEIRSENCGRIVTNKVDWETMNGFASVGNRMKTYYSWRHFVFDENPPNDELSARIEAAYRWEDFIEEN